MDKIEGEGVAIAVLVGAEDGSSVGRVYRWPDGQLTVFWGVKGPQAVARTEPALSPAELEAIGFDQLQSITGPDRKQTPS